MSPGSSHRPDKTGGAAGVAGVAHQNYALASRRHARIPARRKRTTHAPPPWENDAIACKRA
eukprot:10015606-Lingulodinium_polyedra.AAC.1